MPMIDYSCNNPDCDNHITKFYTNASKAAQSMDCGACSNGKLERQLGAPTSKSTQVVDNGIQARKTEIMNDVVERERQRIYDEE